MRSGWIRSDHIQHTIMTIDRKPPRPRMLAGLNNERSSDGSSSPLGVGGGGVGWQSGEMGFGRSENFSLLCYESRGMLDRGLVWEGGRAQVFGFGTGGKEQEVPC